jgi:hypothetical protein
MNLANVSQYTVKDMILNRIIKEFLKLKKSDRQIDALEYRRDTYGVVVELTVYPSDIETRVKASLVLIPTNDKDQIHWWIEAYSEWNGHYDGVGGETYFTEFDLVKFFNQVRAYWNTGRQV